MKFRRNNHGTTWTGREKEEGICTPTFDLQSRDIREKGSRTSQGVVTSRIVGIAGELAGRCE